MTRSDSLRSLAEASTSPVGLTIWLPPVNVRQMVPRRSLPIRFAVTANTRFSMHRVRIASCPYGSTRFAGWQRICAPCSASERAASGKIQSKQIMRPSFAPPAGTTLSVFPRAKKSFSRSKRWAFWYASTLPDAVTHTAELYTAPLCFCASPKTSVSLRRFASFCISTVVYPSGTLSASSASSEPFRNRYPVLKSSGKTMIASDILSRSAAAFRTFSLTAPNRGRNCKKPIRMDCPLETTSVTESLPIEMGFIIPQNPLPRSILLWSGWEGKLPWHGPCSLRRRYPYVHSALHRGQAP